MAPEKDDVFRTPMPRLAPPKVTTPLRLKFKALTLKFAVS